MLTALVDSDTPVFSCALASEDTTEIIAKSRLDMAIRSIIIDSGASDAILFVSGGPNFRKEIDPSYKANRTQPDPRYRESLRLHLIKEWNAVECVGYEADDGCGVNQKTDGSTIICGIDKDLLQIPGRHYQWPIIRKGTVVREGLFHDVSEERGWRNLFTQALTGDTSDNIVGVDGIGKVKAGRLLADLHTEKEMYNAVLNSYLDDETIEEEIVANEQRFLKNMDLLYIWRQLGVTYTIRQELYY